MAVAAGWPRAARLTVWALRESRGLPWHRVVGAGGRIALSGEVGREQRILLEMEGVRFRRDRVRMDLHNWIPSVPKRPRRDSGPDRARDPRARPVRGRRLPAARRPVAPRHRPQT
ncbi:MAG: MGMT family protein [Thermoplasmata archaeon]|nr:MGMT family protein [Thermoplasmata archaeon]